MMKLAVMSAYPPLPSVTAQILAVRRFKTWPERHAPTCAAWRTGILIGSMLRPVHQGSSIDGRTARPRISALCNFRHSITPLLPYSFPWRTPMKRLLAIASAATMSVKRLFCLERRARPVPHHGWQPADTGFHRHDSSRPKDVTGALPGHPSRYCVPCSGRRSRPPCAVLRAGC